MTDQTEINELLQARNFDWAIKAFHPSDQAARYFADQLDALKSFMEQRALGECVPTIESLQSLGKTNPYKLDAFLEALVSLRTSEMIAAAWRIIQGMQVEKIEMQFEYGKSFALRIWLLSPYDENEDYSTNDIDDMNFLRHLIKSKSDNRPIINGFFALRHRKS